MKIHLKTKTWLCALLFVTVFCLNVPAADDSTNAPLRLANGTIIEGTLQEVTPEGLVIQAAKGKYTAAWKYLSAGTRYRYERPMLAAQAAAAKKAAADKAAADKAAADKAAADKAAAAKPAANKAPATNAVGAVSNTLPAKK